MFLKIEEVFFKDDQIVTKTCNFRGLLTGKTRDSSPFSHNQAAFFFKKDVGFVTTFILNLNPINTHTKKDSPLAHCLKKVPFSKRPLGFINRYKK